MTMRFHFWLFALLLVGGSALAGDACRIAYDMGSSGIRAGASTSTDTAQIDIDFLGPLWAGHGLDEVVEPTIAALRDLPRQAGLDPACVAVGGGFSAWRLAAQQDAPRLATQLARISAASGVSVLVVPQVIEGRYGYLAARQVLGHHLTTSHILDIGGGSMQIAGEHTTFGDTLGQKAWHRELCLGLGFADPACVLQPLSKDQLAAGRALLARRLHDVPAALPVPLEMTAISRPVSRGVVVAVEKLLQESVGEAGLSLAQIIAATEWLAQLSPAESAARLGIPDKYRGYVLSDLLLVEGLLRSTGGTVLKVAEADLTNLPGLLRDERAYEWSQHYGCYLQRLGERGLAAYASDPQTCSQAK